MVRGDVAPSNEAPEPYSHAGPTMLPFAQENSSFSRVGFKGNRFHYWKYVSFLQGA